MSCLTAEYRNTGYMAFETAKYQQYNIMCQVILIRKGTFFCLKGVWIRNIPQHSVEECFDFSHTVSKR